MCLPASQPGYVCIALQQRTVRDYCLSDGLKYGTDHIGVYHPCKQYPHSLLCEYVFGSGPQALAAIVRRRVNMNVTAVHLRLGDGLGGADCWTNAKHCKRTHQLCYGDVCDYRDDYILRKNYGLPNIVTRVTYMPKALPRVYYDAIMPPTALPLVLVTGTFRSTGLDDAYIQGAIRYWQNRSYNVSVRAGRDADSDFEYMASAAYFVQGGGGFSGYIAEVSVALGHTVLRHPLAHQCCPKTGPFLCSNSTSVLNAWS